ncbi:MAG: RNA polymerase sigma factor [Dehalococcoidia bacterium]
MTIAKSVPGSYEAALVERLRLGDNAAREELYNRYKSRLYALVLEQVGRNQAVAEDLVQEIFLAALGSLDKFRGGSQLYTWLRSIALHKIYDFYRGQGREPKARKSPTDSDVLPLEQTADEAPAAFTEMESEELRQSVHRALAALPKDYQEVLVLKYLEDMPVLEISQVMGRSPKSVEGLLARARKAMRASLEEDNHENRE